MTGAALIGWLALRGCQRCGITLHGRAGTRCAGCRTRGSSRGAASAQARQDARDVARTSGHGKVARKKQRSTFALVTGEGRGDIASAAPSGATGAARWRSSRAALLADELFGAPSRRCAASTCDAPAHVTTGGHEPMRAMDARQVTTREELHAAELRAVLREAGGLLPLLLAMREGSRPDAGCNANDEESGE